MPERIVLENAMQKLILLAQVRGMTIDDLIALMESGVSISDIVVALRPDGMAA